MAYSNLNLDPIYYVCMPSVPQSHSYKVPLGINGIQLTIELDRYVSVY